MITEEEQRRRRKSGQLQMPVAISRASQLLGLTFGNAIDELLQGGLTPKALTFVYGPNADQLLNILCGNSIRILGGRALFIDAANAYDPYFIVERCTNKGRREEADLREFLQRITIQRAFTCYQLRKLVTNEASAMLSNKKLSRKKREEESKEEIRSVFVAGVDSVFNEQDNTEAETERLQLLMASALSRMAKDETTGVRYVVASSKSRLSEFVSKCDTAIKLFREGKKKDQAMLTKHYRRQFAAVDL